MMQRVQAIYENGMLRLLEPVDLQNGQHIDVELLTEHDKEERLLRLLREQGVLVDAPHDDPEDDFDEEAALLRIQAAFSGGKSLSEIVIEDREDRV